MKEIKSSLLVLALTAAFAGNALAETSAAVVIRDGGCGLYDGNGIMVFTTNTQTVATNSANANATLICKADVNPPANGKAAKYSPENAAEVCVIGSTAGWFVTNDYHETVSAKGKATLVCHYKSSESSEPPPPPPPPNPT